MARTLDLVGERWTLPIVRELMGGPKRFTDLLPGLPGIGRNLLAERLRDLERNGLLRRRELPPPAASRVYELTESGRALGPAMAELGRWGIQHLPPPPPDVHWRPGWMKFPLSYMADTDAARGIRETYEFRIDEDTFHLGVDDGAVEANDGHADRPDLVISMDTATFRGLFEGRRDPVEEIRRGRIRVEGAREALAHALAILAGNPVSAGA